MLPVTNEPHYREPLLKTPFHERARRLSQVDSFIPWAGYTTVDVYSTVEQEYFAIRNSASLYDLTPMVKYRIAGSDALRYLNRLVTRDLRKLRPGRVSYVVWCDDAGHLIDDGTIFRLGESEFRLCTGERQLDWLLASAIGFEVEIAEVTSDIAALSLQGPVAAAVLRKFGLEGIERLAPFELGRFALPGRTDATAAPAGAGAAATTGAAASAGVVMVSRTGFTGDLGYELWMHPTDAEAVWDGLFEAGRTRNLRPIGSRALNLARIEAGFIMPAMDFISSERTVRIGTERSPLELGLGWLVDFGKGHFTGRRALLEAQRRGLRRQLVGLEIEGNKPAHNALLYSSRSGRRQVGNITSAAWSPTCKRSIALALLDAPHFSTGSEVWAEIYINRELEWERRMSRARVVERPFFAPARRRATPPGDL